MKTWMKLVALVLLVTSVSNAGSAEDSGKQKPTVKKNPSQLGTSFRFDGADLRGKYQSSPSTVATVENDKFLEDLLGARKSFKDREKEDNERN